MRGQNSLVSVIAKDSREGRDDVIAFGKEWRFNHGLIRNSTEYSFEKFDYLFFLLNTRAIPFVGMGVEMTNSPSDLLQTAFRAFYMPQANRRPMQVHAQRTNAIKMTVREDPVVPLAKNGPIAAIT